MVYLSKAELEGFFSDLLREFQEYPFKNNLVNLLK